MSTGNCASGDYCLPSGTANACYAPSNPEDVPALVAAGILAPDGAVLADGSPGGGPDGSTGSDGSGGGPQDGAGEGGDALAGNACPSAQTQFGNPAASDSDPHFTSGVGARSSGQLLAFNGYVGPDPTAGASSAEAGVTSYVGWIYVQSFDPATGASQGAAQALFNALPSSAISSFGHATALGLVASAVAPTGEIALVYTANYVDSGGYGMTALLGAFVSPSTDAGSALQLQKVVLLETATVGGQPYVIWSNASQAFVMTWQYSTSAWFVKVNKFLKDGRAAGGNTDVVPTNDPSGAIWGAGGYVSAGVGESGGLFGIAYKSSGGSANSPSIAYNPALTVLDTLGNQVGSTINMIPSGPTQDTAWVTVAGTAQGFVYFYDNLGPPGVIEAFAATSGDAGVIEPSSDGGDGGAFPGFSFTGAVRANAARAIGDDTGGVGGVGVGLLYSNSVSFAYVNPDGAGHQGPNTVFAHAYASGDKVSMTNFNGSFVVSLYDSAAHLTRVAASGCK
jgi:hypothetical protein